MSSRAALIVACLALAACSGPAAVSPSPARPVTSTPSATPSLTALATAPTSPIAIASPTATTSPIASASPTPTSVADVAPYCAVADVLTPIDGYAEHQRTYLDWTYALRDTYLPPDLVSAVTGAPVTITPFAIEAVGAAEILARRGDPSYSTLLTDAPNAAIRAVAYADLARLRAAASAAGHPLVIVSAYRSYELQVRTFEYWTNIGGYQQALRTSARPGHSEHQLGTAIDFGDGAAGPWEYADWATTPTGAWLAAHSREYGFVQSFPKGKTSVTCYDYEPWHYRWVGPDVVAAVTAAGLTLREYQGTSPR